MMYLSNGILSDVDEKAIATNSSMDETHKHVERKKPEIRLLNI